MLFMHCWNKILHNWIGSNLNDRGNSLQYDIGNVFSPKMVHDFAEDFYSVGMGNVIGGNRPLTIGSRTAT